MADPEKDPDSHADTRMDTQPTESWKLSESQDFQLIDEESEKDAQDVTQLAEKVSEEESKISVEKEDIICSEPGEKNEKGELDAGNDDDDDFIPSSQLETDSPLKKQIFGLMGGISQKRKAEMPEEPPQAKFPRTCSQEDALSSVKKKLNDEDNLFDNELADESLKEAVTSNAIIEETQESNTSEVEAESLQQVEKELEEALSQHELNDGSTRRGDNEKKEKSSPIKESSPIEEKKSSIIEALEDKIVSSISESPQYKKSEESNDENVSSLREVIEDEKSSNGNTQVEPESMRVETEEEKMTLMEVDELKKSSLEAVEDERKEQMKNCGEKDNGKETKISDVPSENSKEPKKDDCTPGTTCKEDDKTELAKDSPTADTKDNEAEAIVTDSGEKSNDSEISIKKQTEAQIPPISIPSNRSRMSIEVIYDKATAPPEKKRPRELVEIDEDGEKIVLDSSQEDGASGDKSMEKTAIESKIESSYKSCESKACSTDYKSIDTSKDSSKDTKASYSLTNGSADTKKTDSDKTASPGSDLLADDDSQLKKIESIVPSKKARLAPQLVISISDSEGDSFVVDEKTKNKLEPINRENPTIKVVEKELSILVKLKCSVHIDENTKEHVDKVITWVQSESCLQDLSSTRRRNSDASASLADISGNAGGNKDASPGSVTSLAQPYTLNSRHSLASTISTSSASSAASMHAKLAANPQFQLPRVPVKHAKKSTTEIAQLDGKQESNNQENFEHISREWKHVGLLLTSFFNCAREELIASDLHNGSTEKVDNSLEIIRSSTPELEEKDKTVAPPMPIPGNVTTPKSTTKRTSRSTKRSRSKTVRSVGSNGLSKTSPVREAQLQVASATPSSTGKSKSSPETPTSRQSTNTKDSLNDTYDQLLGKEVFAKWSDNKYYPGTVIGKTKTKFKVNFYDGQQKLIIEDFIVPMPSILHVGLSVYATSSDDDYGSCGIIIDAKKHKDNVIYTVQTDEQEEIRVQIKNIFLTNDQVQVLREETKVDLQSPPSTPKHLGKVTLDNVVDGKRRSKRITTPVVSTPKGKRARGSLADKSVDISKPSTSGVSLKTKTEESYDSRSDSNYSALEETELLGVQPELTGTPNEQESKGPASRLKGKARGRKKAEDPDVVAKLGPIPPANSNIFNGMSFLLTCASLDTIDRFQNDTKDSNSDPGTENEEEWTRQPFVRDRLIAQINAGGGKFYESFESIPPEEYDNTKLITNVPNLTKKSLLCLSVGIKAYNHQWIIRCCKENKIVNPSEEELPAGWSLMKQSYVEMFQRRNKKPFQTLPVIVVIPLIPGEEDFVTYWTQICQNAGGAVLLPENPYHSFIEGTVVLTNKRCPSWVIEKAKSWSIPIVSTTWVIQSLIEGNICTYDAHPSFDYNYVKRPLSHISNLKRLE